MRARHGAGSLRPGLLRLGWHPGTGALLLAVAGLVAAGGALMAGMPDRHHAGPDPLIAHRSGFDYEINPSALAPAGQEQPPAGAVPAGAR